MGKNRLELESMVFFKKMPPAAQKCIPRYPQKNGKMGVSGRVCWYVACYDSVLGFNVSSLVLMIFQVGFWGSF